MKVRWGVKEIVADLAANGLVVAGLAKALIRAGATAVVRQQSGVVFGAAVAKAIETVITDTPGVIEAKERLAGAISANIGAVCDRIKDMAGTLCDAQIALEKARGTAGEDAARAHREAAEADVETSIPELGRLVAAG